MTTLAEFHTELAAALKRGSTLDARIPLYVKRAAREIEKNHTYLNMETFGEFTLDSSATYPRVVQLPAGEDLIKEVLMFRYIVSSDSSFVYLYGVDPRRIVSFEEGAPTGYWRQGNTNLVVDTTPDVDYDCEILWSQFTDWPTDTSAEPRMVDHEASLLMAETLLAFAKFLRDPKMRMEYQTDRDEAFRLSVEADLQAREANTQNASGYTAFRGER